MRQSAQPGMKYLGPDFTEFSQLATPSIIYTNFCNNFCACGSSRPSGLCHSLWSARSWVRVSPYAKSYAFFGIFPFLLVFHGFSPEFQSFLGLNIYHTCLWRRLFLFCLLCHLICPHKPKNYRSFLQLFV